MTSNIYYRRCVMPCVTIMYLTKPTNLHLLRVIMRKVRVIICMLWVASCIGSDYVNSKVLTGHHDVLPLRVSIVENHIPGLSSDKYRHSLVTNGATRHIHDKQYPPFDVIKCIVEQMTTRILVKRDVSQSAQRDDSDWEFSAPRRHIESHCKKRYRRHKLRSASISKGAHNKSKEENSSSKDMSTTDNPSKHTYSDKDYHYLLTKMPQPGANCSTMSTFLSNEEHLRFVYQKTKDLHCLNDNLQRMFHTLRELNNATKQHQIHRIHATRKWKHLACRVYLVFIKCAHNILSPVTDGPNPQFNRTQHEASTNMMDKSILTHTSPASTKEAVHVSDSSHIDFLNFMIGQDTEWSDDYQMWFY